ncbi:MAG: hypothetical protein V4733_02740 [Verrucomicrobiota bacterium]
MKPKTVLFGLCLLVFAVGLVWWSQRDADRRDVAITSSPSSPANAGNSPTTSSPENPVIRPDRKDAAANSGRPSSETPPPAPLAPPVWPMASSGSEATATVVVNGARHRLVPNQLGEFQRVYVETGGSVDVTVRYPAAKPGDKIIAAMQDGGTLNGKGIAEQFTVDSSGNIAFSAETRDEGGIHRVLLTKGADRKTLDIWGGAESPLKADIQP